MQSVVGMPLEVTGSMLGAITFSSVRTQRDWSEELLQRLRLVGQVFANAMMRRRAEEALRPVKPGCGALSGPRLRGSGSRAIGYCWR